MPEAKKMRLLLSLPNSFRRGESDAEDGVDEDGDPVGGVLANESSEDESSDGENIEGGDEKSGDENIKNEAIIVESEAESSAEEASCCCVMCLLMFASYAHSLLVVAWLACVLVSGGPP